MDPDEEVEDIELRLFLEAIHARYGYDLRQYASPTMRRRVFAVLARTGLAHLGELQHRVLTDPTFFAEILDDLTVQVSELFRDPQHYQTFRARVIPILRTYPLIRIWHAGCASGEEVYSSAILLTEEGLYDRAQIYATDLSQRAIEQAKQGVYPLDRLPAFAANYQQSGGTAELARYYREVYDQIVMRESLRKNVLFFQHNLVSDQVFGEMHVVICRNVLIYFERELRERVVAKLTRSLQPGGFLFLGGSERLTPAEGVSEFAARERIYRIGGGST